MFFTFNEEIKADYTNENVLLFNNDCIKVMKKIPDETIDLILSDPPYLIDYKSNMRKDKNHEFCTPIANDNNFDFIHDYIFECYRILKQNKAMYMFCNDVHVDYFKQELKKAGFNIKNMIIWVKNGHSAGDLQAQFGKQYEIIFLVNKGRCKFNGKRITDVWHFDRVAGKSQFHQNQKPVDLLKLCIEKHSQEGDIVFDGVFGSCSTGVASIELGRKFIGCELEERYFCYAENRLINVIYKGGAY